MLMSPLWWLACSTIIIPLIIHWFNQTRVELIKFSHIALLPQAERQQQQRRRLQHWLLLLVRMLLLLVATWLAGQLSLRWSPFSPPSIVVVSPAWLSAATDTERHTLLQQQQAGQQIWVAADQPYQWVANNQSTLISRTPFSARLSNLLTNQPANSRVDVYVTDRVSQTGLQPAQLRQQVNWHVKHLAEETDSVAPIKVLLIQPPVRQIYLRAALQALQQQFTLRIYQLDEQTVLTQSGQFDWIFVADNPSTALQHWLKTSANHGAVVLNYPTHGDIQHIQQVHWPDDQEVFLTLYRLTSPALLVPLSDTTQIVWQTPQGEPLLSRQFIGLGQWLRLDVALHPQSSQLVLSGHFPRWLGRLMLSASRSLNSAHDAQLVANKSAFTNTKTNSPPNDGWPLFRYLTIPLLLLWLLERILAAKLRQQQVVHD